MPKRITCSLIAFFLCIVPFSYAQVVGPYTGITWLTSLTGPCNPTTLNILGDNDFTVNGTYEIAYGSTFSGTWASGLGYANGPGPEILCVSLHTEESWNVALRLSDGSTTPAINSMMNTILDYVTWNMYSCGGAPISGWYYDRRISFVDFASYPIPPGVTVIGATFTLATDNAGFCDPVGMVLLNALISNVESNGPVCMGDSLLLDADYTPGSTYSWTGPNGFTSNIESPFIYPTTLANAGIYTCIMTDPSTGAVDTGSTTVIIHELPNANIVLPVACETRNGNYSFTGANDTITGQHWDFGTPAANDTSNIAAPVFNYSSDGSYTITLALLSDEGCRDTVNANILVHSLPVATMTSDTICAGGSFTYDPTIVADTTVNYSWTFPSGNPAASTDSAETVTYVTSGSFAGNLVLTSGFGCSDTFSFPLLVLPNPTANLGPDQSFCFGDNIILNPGAFAGYVWSTGATTPTITVSTTGTYIVGVVNAFGCVDADTMVVQNVYPLPVANMGPDQEICFGENTILNPGSFASYLWQDGSTGSTFSVSAGGQYIVEVTDFNTCQDLDTVLVTRHSLPVFTLGPDGMVCPGEAFDILPTDPGVPVTYLWSDNTTTPTLTVFDFGTYYLTMTDIITGCKYTDTLDVLLECPPTIYVPSAFTPNDDNFNPLFRAYGSNIKNFKMEIFNRWGQHIYTVNDISNGWNGRLGEENAPMGVYIYKITYRTLLVDDDQILIGNFSLLR